MGLHVVGNLPAWKGKIEKLESSTKVGKRQIRKNAMKLERSIGVGFQLLKTFRHRSMLSNLNENFPTSDFQT